MGKLLDRLAEQYALVWLGYVACAWLLAFRPGGYGLVIWTVAALMAAVTVLALLDYLYRYAPLQRAQDSVGHGQGPWKRDNVLAALCLSSSAMMIAVFWVFDLHDEAFLPFLFSVSVPGMLKRRQAELDLVASQLAAG